VLTCGQGTGDEGQFAMPSEAEKYRQYSQECLKQAVQAKTQELRDQLFDLARVWTEAALREGTNAKAGRTNVAQNRTRGSASWVRL
jgi:hypothetical protein